MSVRLLRFLLVAWSFVLGGWATVSAQDIGGTEADVKEGSGGRNIYTSKSDLETGRQLMLAVCSLCHGVDSRGGRGPDLMQGSLRRGKADAEIFDNIKNGVPGTDMVGIDLEDRPIWQIVAYIQSQRKNVKPAVVTGDRVAGRKLFAQHKCGSCHWTQGGGGRQGPDLRKSRSTIDYAKSAIVDPNKKVDPRYLKVVVVMRDGRISQGLRLDEDSYHIQFIDSEEKLHTVPKSKTSQIRIAEESLMPSYGKELNPRQLEDLIAYLFSLREE